jgi:hypothetical protein
MQETPQQRGSLLGFQILMKTHRNHKSKAKADETVRNLLDWICYLCTAVENEFGIKWGYVGSYVGADVTRALDKDRL